MENEKLANNNPSFDGFLENLNNLTDEELQSIYGGVGVGVNAGGVGVDVNLDSSSSSVEITADVDVSSIDSSTEDA